MEVFINNQLKQLTKETSLQSLLLEFGFEEVRGIAVAVNEQVVPKPQWNSYFLADRDSITIIRATQGG
jgi:sulfur carrier protein